MKTSGAEEAPAGGAPGSAAGDAEGAPAGTGDAAGDVAGVAGGAGAPNTGGGPSSILVEGAEVAARGCATGTGVPAGRSCTGPIEAGTRSE